MPSFEFSPRLQPPTGYQRHHLIPLQIVRHRSFAAMFANLSDFGFRAHDFATNGVCLPACERIALETGLPLHRGPHRQYTQLVSEQIAFLFGNQPQGNFVALMVGLSHLQGTLRRSLQGSHSMLLLNKRDPRFETAGIAKFDVDLRRLSMTNYLS